MPPWPLATAELLSDTVLPFLEFHTNRILQKECGLCVFLLSLSLLCSSCFFLFVTESYPIVWIHRFFAYLSHRPVDEYDAASKTCLCLNLVSALHFLYGPEQTCSFSKPFPRDRDPLPLRLSEKSMSSVPLPRPPQAASAACWPFAAKDFNSEPGV